MKGTLRGHLVQLPSKDAYRQIRLLGDPTILTLNVSKDGASTTHLGNLCQCFTTVIVKSFSLACRKSHLSQRYGLYLTAVLLDGLLAPLGSETERHRMLHQHVSSLMLSVCFFFRQVEASDWWCSFFNPTHGFLLICDREELRKHRKDHSRCWR